MGRLGPWLYSFYPLYTNPQLAKFNHATPSLCVVYTMPISESRVVQLPPPSTHYNRHRQTTHQVCLSNSSFASLTFVAKYGLPPRSGWFSSIIVRCALRTLSLVMLRSLPIVSTADHGGIKPNLLEGQDKRSLLLGHFGLEAALVEGFAHGSDTASGAAPCDETGSALRLLVFLPLFRVRVVLVCGRTRNAATAAPAPIAKTELIFGEC